MALGFGRQRPEAVFVRPKTARSRPMNPTATDARAVAGPGGRERARHFAGPGPGCGLGAACARAERWAELAFAGFWAKKVTMSPRADFVFSFSKKIEK